VLVPLFLPQANQWFDSGKNNGVVCRADDAPKIVEI
jgi:hypothetical protein